MGRGSEGKNFACKVGDFSAQNRIGAASMIDSLDMNVGAAVVIDPREMNVEAPVVMIPIMKRIDENVPGKLIAH